MGYTSERNNQIVIELLKYHGIKKVVASPGATNVSFIASIQNDPWFEIYSSIDERSAAYIACGIAAESGETVVLSCTGATASRNYFPGLTEAYYRKLPILAITSTMPMDRIGNNMPQCIDRTNLSNDIAKLSVHIPMIKDQEDEWSCCLRVNEAILELRHHGLGPVHINLETDQSGNFEVRTIEKVNVIDRIPNSSDSMPCLEEEKIAIFVGNHEIWDQELITAVDIFCEKYNAVVIGDHTSNYKGAYSVPAGLISTQLKYKPECMKIDILIHIGNVSGAYLNIQPRQVWRINVDGRLCDTFRKLRYVFEMSELEFFTRYNKMCRNDKKELTYYKEWKLEYNKLLNKIKEIPFSNIWIAKQMSKELPENSVLHLGILNSLRSWNFFEISKTIEVYSNTGGFGIDGCVSSLLGAAIAAPNKLFFGVVGDLAFFYDMNCLGNRHLGNNIRLVVINNGIGQEFKNYGHRAAQFDKDTDFYIAAAGHYGNKSKGVIKNYAQNLGFKYLCADNKDDAKVCLEEFLNPEIVEYPIILEIFTETEKETEALKELSELEVSTSENIKSIVKNVVGQKSIDTIKKIIKK